MNLRERRVCLSLFSRLLSYRMLRSMPIRSFSTRSVFGGIPLDPSEVAACRKRILQREQHWLQAELKHSQKELAKLRQNPEPFDSPKVNIMAARERVLSHHVCDVYSRLTATQAKVQRSATEIRLRNEAQRLHKAMEASLKKQMKAAEKLKQAKKTRNIASVASTPQKMPARELLGEKCDIQCPLTPRQTVMQQAMKEGLSLQAAADLYKALDKKELERLKIEYKKQKLVYVKALQGAPKLLSGYQLFVKESAHANAHGSVVEHKSSAGAPVDTPKPVVSKPEAFMRDISARWNSLPEAERAAYSRKARVEYEEATALWERRKNVEGVDDENRGQTSRITSTEASK